MNFIQNYVSEAQYYSFPSEAMFHKPSIYRKAKYLTPKKRDGTMNEIKIYEMKTCLEEIFTFKLLFISHVYSFLYVHLLHKLL